MIKEDKRKVVRTLFNEGKKKKEIGRLVNLSPKTVRKILSGDVSKKQRIDKKILDIDLLRDVYNRCDGYVQRVYEILTEEYGIKIGYSTLTRMIRHNNIGQKIDKRCFHVGDVPGEEMQHDVTSYKLKIGGKITRVICSALYLRYSKMRYVKFYPYFNRFKMKCFLYEALTYLKYTAKTCVIDNTSLAILHGTGKNAVFCPEMTAFAKTYGFSWIAHEKGHANRKAGEERTFWTIETNFIPGRMFIDWEDLNHQGFDWSTVRYAKRPQSKTGLIPIVLFEQEKPYLIKLPEYIEPPYKPHKRGIDKYGYIPLDANFYWIPGKSRGEVSVIEYPNKIKIFPPGQAPIEYLLPAWGTRNKKISPQGVDVQPPYEPRHIKKPCHEEERKLRYLGKILCEYLDFIKSSQSDVKQKPHFIRDLYGLRKKMAPSLFIATIERALKYRVANIETLIRISSQLMEKGLCDFPTQPINNDYEKREAYQEGRFSQEEDFGFYKNMEE